jgi:cytochrome c oxidase subunit 4
MNNHITTHSAENYGTYIAVWLGLVALTLITVALAGFNLLYLTVVTALAIAVVKSLLVVNYFMHVRTDSAVFKIFIGVCLATFIIMVVLTFFDITFRTPIK